MAGKIPNTSEKELLKLLLGDLGTLWTVRLYKQLNNMNPDNVVPGDFVECDFPGYSAQAMFNWDAPVTDANGVAYMLSPLLTITRNATGAGQTALGYYMTRTVNMTTVLFGYHEFATPVTVTSNGDKVEFKVKALLTNDSSLT